MKIYFAAPYSMGAYVLWLQDKAVEIGHESTSSWVEQSAASDGLDLLPTMSHQQRAWFIDQNDRDVKRADLLVAVVARGLGKEMFCEAALAHNLGIPVYWVGPEDLMPLSAWRVGSAIVPDDTALLAVLRDLAGVDGPHRVRCAVRQV